MVIGSNEKLRLFHFVDNLETGQLENKGNDNSEMWQCPSFEIFAAGKVK